SAAGRSPSLPSSCRSCGASTVPSTSHATQERRAKQPCWSPSRPDLSAEIVSDPSKATTGLARVFRRVEDAHCLCPIGFPNPSTAPHGASPLPLFLDGRRTQSLKI